jgi:transposase
MTAAIQDTSRFAGPGKFAAFLGLTPKQNSSGGKPKQGRISKMGDRYLRKPLVGAPMRCRFNASRTPTRCGCGRRS